MSKRSEYDWLELEAKVRQFVHDLLSPFQKRLLDNAAGLVESRKEVRQLKDSVAELEQVMTGSETGQSGLLKVLDDRVTALSKALLQQKNEASQLEDRVSDRLEGFERQAAHAARVVKDCEGIRDRVSLEMAELNQAMAEFKNDTQELVKKLGQ
jgi:hypothetical protein